MILKKIVKEGLCIGCGFCSAVCPSGAIQMRWTPDAVWVPEVNNGKCINCGLCEAVCPNSPKCIKEYAEKSALAGERSGLEAGVKCFLAHVQDSQTREKSASGGVLTEVMRYLLGRGEIDGVIASFPIVSGFNEPHYELRVVRSPEELESARSSHYYPACYDNSLKEIAGSDGRYALVGVPCVIRAVERLPLKFRNKIKYTFGLVCSHNVNGQFIDCLARQMGVSSGERFKTALRDKKGSPKDANNFSSCFTVGKRDIRRNRFHNAFTSMWRNYFFALEGCLYCPDFYAADADVSVKDAWGLFSKDPGGSSMMIVRNPEIEAVLMTLEREKRISARRCGSGEVLRSQPLTPGFKQVDVINRIRNKKVLKKEFKADIFSGKGSKRTRSKNFIEYAHFRIMIFLSKAVYPFWPENMAKIVGTVSNCAEKGLVLFVKVIQMGSKVFSGIFSPWVYIVKGAIRYHSGRTLGKSVKESTKLKVVLLGGYGYRNVGDEAQLARVIENWKNSGEAVEITVLSPDPGYTEATHGEHSSPAPRTVLFESADNGNYVGSNILFRWRYRWIKPRMLRFAGMYASGRIPSGAYPQELSLLRTIAEADVLHFGGGGYLTGMTLSRLWDGMLIMKIANMFSTPVILSGQTIGVFKDRTSRKLAKWGLSLAEMIYLRDPEGSRKDLEKLGIEESKVRVTFDDALFCGIAGKEDISRCLVENGVSADIPYVTVNVHYFKQGKKLAGQCTSRMAEICDALVEERKLQVVFLPMTPSDSKAIEETRRAMRQESRVIDYEFDYRVAKGVIGGSSLMLTMKHHGIIFAMGSAVPAIAVALDDYYIRKNAGALKLFGQEKLLLDDKSLFEPRIAERMIFGVLDEKEVLKKEIREHLDRKRPLDGEIIKRFLGKKDKEKE